jgi:diguanylate cyclase (GGDEF)-like protein/PAS domain S-box-containing protein
MGVGVVLFDADDRLVLWNKRYADIHYGEDADRLAVGASFEELVRLSQERGGREYGDEKDRAEWLERRLARHRLPENSEEIRLPDNRWIKVEERRTSDGGSVGVRVDITEIKRREESFRLLFAANPAPMWVFDNETARFLAVNDAAVEHYGYSRERFLAMTVLEIRPPEEAKRVRRHMASRRRQNGELWRHRKANGEDIDVAVYGRIMDYEGRPATLIAAIDVTNARRAEAEAQRAREFLNAVFENVPAPIIVKEAGTSRMVLVNRAAETFLGAPRVELIGKTPSEIYSGGEGTMLAGFDRQALQEGREFVSDEYRVDTPGNGVRFVTSKRVPILDESGSPSYVVTVINDITERKRANERIAHLTTHDPMTGLANREAFGRKLADALARSGQRGVAALCVDLDRFKEINEIKGYAIGDAALRAAASRLQKTAGETFIARVGGDEFSLVVEGEEQPATAIAIADRLLAAFAEEIDVDDVTLKMGLSIGVAISPADGCDAPTLLANAEAALHRAKREGRGVARFFEAEMDSKLRERRALQHELKSAISRGQLRVHYQPQANMAGEIFGFEALARWLHPTRGFVPPSLFIPLAEESGAIKEIGEWILREACREAASWPRLLSVSVNLSSVQFRQGDLIDMIQRTLVETGLSGRRLELEITESALIDDPDSARAILRRIKALGVRIAMDDFGTGYSSLSYLQSFPFDKIKIDRSFIVGLDGNPQAGAIIRAVIGLAHGLHLPVIAEGVETKEQLAFLKRETCDEIQGYIVGRPEAMEAYARAVGRRGGKGGLKVVA